MSSRPKHDPDDELPREPRGRTPEEREDQIISLAYDLAEKRIREGTASAQENVFFLKMGSSRERLERERLGMELEFMEVKKEALASEQRMESLFEEAIQAFRGYSPTPSPELEGPTQEYDGYEPY